MKNFNRLSYKRKSAYLKREIYSGRAGCLADRVDFAFKIYFTVESEPNDEQLKLRKSALLFLMHVFDIQEPLNIDQRLLALRADRKAGKAANPDYVPGQTALKITPEQWGKLRKTNDLVRYDQRIIKSKPYKEAVKSAWLLPVYKYVRWNDQWRHIKFFNDSLERAPYQVLIRGGLLYKDHEKLTTERHISHEKNGYIAYTLNANGELSVFAHYGGENGLVHSSMNAGMPVVAAGEINVVNGELRIINTYSGHYRPSLFHVYRMLSHLCEKSVDITKTKVHTVEQPAGYGLHHAKQINVSGQIYYEIAASELFSHFNHVLDEVLRGYQTSIKTYFYRAVDSITGSDLTLSRYQLAKKFRSDIKLLMREIADVDNPKKLGDYVILLKTYLHAFQAQNNAISARHGKAIASGRLANMLSLEHFNDVYHQRMRGSL